MNKNNDVGQNKKILKQQEWSSGQLRQEGFQKFSRKKTVVLARRVRDEEAPKHISTAQGDQLVAKKGYMICYVAGDEVHATIDEYEQWPVEPDIFKRTYRYWDEPLDPTPAEKHLMQHGCQAYYKDANVWAKELKEDTYYQSLEHDAPVKAETGKIMAIGVEGEPYAMGQNTFFDRYDRKLEAPLVPPAPPTKTQKRTWVNRLVNFFKGEN